MANERNGNRTKEPTQTVARRVDYGVTEQAIAKLADEHAMTTIENRQDYDKCVKSIAVFRNLRGEVTRRHKQEKADALEWCRLVDAGKKALLELLSEPENRLKDLKAGYDEKKAKEKAAKAEAERQRVRKIDGAIHDIERLASQRFKTSKDVQKTIDGLEAMEPAKDVFQEKYDQAKVTKDETLKALQAILKARNTKNARPPNWKNSAKSRRPKRSV